MKTNQTNNPSISSISLSDFNVSDCISKPSFSGRFFLGCRKGDQEVYGGEFIAGDGTFPISEESIKKIEELVNSLENDLSDFLFGADKKEAVKEEPALDSTDDRFLI